LWRFHRDYKFVLSKIEKYRKRGINITLLHNFNSFQYLKHLENIYHLTDLEIYDDSDDMGFDDSPFNTLIRLIQTLNLETKTFKPNSKRTLRFIDALYSRFCSG
jgi:hypothetical protein